MSSFKRRTPTASPTIPGVRLSPHTGTHQTSTGIPSLDSLLAGGLPLGTVTLLQEDQFTRYARLIASYFVAQGMVAGHAICFASAEEGIEEFMSGLMRVVEGPQPVDEEEADTPKRERVLGGLRDVDGDRMRIAWRYQNLPILSTDKRGGSILAKTPYCATFDLTKRMDEGLLKGTKMAFIDVSTWSADDQEDAEKQDMYDKLYCQIETLITQGGFRFSPTNPPQTALRIFIQSLSSPLWPTPTHHAQRLHRFLHTLRRLLRESAAVCLITLPTPFPIDLAPLHHTSDAVLSLTSFASHPSVYESIYNGFLEVIKVPRVGCLGQVDEEVGALGFRVRRKRFEIERVGLPPEEEEKGRGEVKKAGCGSTGNSVLDF
ncbi:hypothetical protein SpCBS45565_g06190 [Spizellomyces sp. 'palustris']|nr:hypothetical protein SpCBS45565_g06190 [Spizellomyces sp. 'palustris']